MKTILLKGEMRSEVGTRTDILKRTENLVKNKFFMKALVSNIEATIYFLKSKK